MPYVLALPRRLLELEHFLLQAADLRFIDTCPSHAMASEASTSTRRQRMLGESANMHWQGLHCFRLIADE